MPVHCLLSFHCVAMYTHYIVSNDLLCTGLPTFQLVSCLWCFAQGWEGDHNQSVCLPSCAAAKVSGNPTVALLYTGLQYTHTWYIVHIQCLLQYIIQIHTAVNSTHTYSSVQFTYCSIQYIHTCTYCSTIQILHYTQ